MAAQNNLGNIYTKNKHPVSGLDFALFKLSLYIESSGCAIEFLFNKNPLCAISVQYNNISKEKELYAIVSGKQNEMKKHLAPLKDKKKDMDLVIGLMGKGLLLSGTIKQVLANMGEKKTCQL
ncbi:hypothetical protein RhiirA4_453938 [Rhizophagus irregularis]|uniref:Uncharacterized protein n=1 Tax=Rhizophagus irregularis TaxID=588596 RepID=A0A2I1G1N8_9GLOM|nr:hypothetical protein RhiirA4_453938 [Rhizophagus irregularis]